MPPELYKLLYAAEADLGVGMGVNRLHPQFPGQDGDLAQAS